MVVLWAMAPLFYEGPQRRPDGEQGEDHAHEPAPVPQRHQVAHDHLDHQDDAAAAAVDPLHRAPPDQRPRRGRAPADAAPECEDRYDADGEPAPPEDVG